MFQHTQQHQAASFFYHLVLLSVSNFFFLSHLRGIVHACLIFSNFSRLLKKVRMKIYGSSGTRERLRNDISKVP